MNDQIKFDGEEQSGSILYSRFERSVQAPKMVRWVLSMGIAKSEQAAKYVLLAVAIGATVLAFIIPSFISGHVPLARDFSQTDRFFPPATQP